MHHSCCADDVGDDATSMAGHACTTQDRESIDRLTPTLQCAVDVAVILVVRDTCPVPRVTPALSAS